MGALDDVNKAHARVVARAWTDPAFRDKLSADPKSALAEEGLHVPDGVAAHVHFADANTVHLVVPPAPAAPSANAPTDAIQCIQSVGTHTSTNAIQCIQSITAHGEGASIQCIQSTGSVQCIQSQTTQSEGGIQCIQSIQSQPHTTQSESGS